MFKSHRIDYVGRMASPKAEKVEEQYEGPLIVNFVRPFVLLVAIVAF